MIFSNGATPTGDLDALFPGLGRLFRPARPAEDPFIRAVGSPPPVAASRPSFRGPLAILNDKNLREANALAARMFGAFWADPLRMLWTPFFAGAGVRMWELDPELFPADFATPARLLISASRDAASMNDLQRMAVVELGTVGVSLLAKLWPEARALAEFGLGGEWPLPRRIERLEQCLETSALPATWVAIQLPAAVGISGTKWHPLMVAARPYRRLGERFATLAERQGIRTWEAALADSMAYWRDPRGNGVLKALLDTISVPTMPTMREDTARLIAAAPEPDRGQIRKLDAKLAQAKEEAIAARAEAEARRERLAAAQREAAEARQSRDRVAERLRMLERENEELRKSLGEARPATVEPAAEPVQPEVQEPARPDIAPVPQVDLATVFAGRRVYLYTGIERVMAREAMGKALERHGAICEVFDANRLTLLGPERFPADAMVIVETSHIGHSTSEAIQSRARASGAWVFIGATGSGALARRVAARWWKTHPGERPRASA